MYGLNDETILVLKSDMDELDRLRKELATAEGEADRLRSAYDDVRALNIKLTTTCTAELATKNARIAQLEAWRAACQEVRCYRVVEAETEALRTDNEALRKQLQDERNDHDHTIARLTERLEASHGALKDALKLGDDTIEALRKELAEARAANARWRDMVDVAKANGFDSLTDAITQAKAANARIADQQVVLDYHMKQHRLVGERAERAEARIAELEPHGAVADLVSNLRGRIVELLARAERAEAHIKELNDKWADDVLRVERTDAECKTMRNLLDRWRSQIDHGAWRNDLRQSLGATNLAHDTRAALNPAYTKE